MNGIQFIVNQMTGNIPEVPPGPTRRHGMPMCGSIQSTPEPEPKKKRIRPDVDTKELRRLFDAGETFGAIEIKTGLTRPRAIRLLGDAYRPRRAQRAPDDALRDAAAMRARGMQWAEITERLGFHQNTLYYGAKRRGYL